MADAIFQVAQAQQAKYLMEESVWTGWPFAGTGNASSLSTGTTLLINLKDWNVKGSPTWRAEVSMIQTSRDTAGTTFLTYSADSADNPGLTSAPGNTAAAHTRFLQEPAKVAGVYNVQVQLVNNNASATANWQTNFGMRLRRLTAIDKLLAQRDGLSGGAGQWYALTGAELTALQNLNVLDASGDVTMSGLDALKSIVDAGYGGPNSAEWLRENLFRGRTYQETPDWFYPSTTSSSTNFAGYTADLRRTATGGFAGRFPILIRLGIPGASNVAVPISRDNSTYVTVQGMGFQQVDDSDWHFWLPAIDTLQLNAKTGQGGTDGSYGIRVQVAQCSMSDTLAVLFGLVKSRDELSDPYVFDKAIAGLFI